MKSVPEYRTAPGGRGYSFAVTTHQTPSTRFHLRPMAPRDPGQPHRTASPLELFFDLVFVVAIERRTHLLHGDPGRGCIAATIGLTMLVWFAWST